MWDKLRNLPIALKLNLTLGMTTVIVAVLSLLWVSSSVRQQLENQALGDMERTNKLVVGMFDAYNRAMAQDIERSAKHFAALFAGAAEELPAIAEEMSGQASLLQQTMRFFQVDSARRQAASGA